MKLEGSCHCQSVKFSLQSKHPYPFNICYCSICRKAAGNGGYAINLSGDADTLEFQDKEHLSIYQAKLINEETKEVTESPSQRNFCKVCSSHLWAWDPRWPELLHPQASAIDTNLPSPPEHTHLMLDSKPEWVPVHSLDGDQCFNEYPNESIAAWHERLGLNE